MCVWGGGGGEGGGGRGYSWERGAAYLILLSVELDAVGEYLGTFDSPPLPPPPLHTHFPP